MVAWQIFAWEPVYASASTVEKAASLLRPVNTTVGEPRPGVPRSGHTIWVGALDGHQVGVCWDWSELRPNVITLTDPMKLLSNIRLVDGDGFCLDQSSMALYLNTLVNELDWQQHVREKTLH
jgi:hypothetical protein